MKRLLVILLVSILIVFSSHVMQQKEMVDVVPKIPVPQMSSIKGADGQVTFKETESFVESTSKSRFEKTIHNGKWIEIRIKSRNSAIDFLLPKKASKYAMVKDKEMINHYLALVKLGEARVMNKPHDIFGAYEYTLVSPKENFTFEVSTTGILFYDDKYFDAPSLSILPSGLMAYDEWDTPGNLVSMICHAPFFKYIEMPQANVRYYFGSGYTPLIAEAISAMHESDRVIPDTDYDIYYFYSGGRVITVKDYFDMLVIAYDNETIKLDYTPEMEERIILRILCMG